MNSSVISTLNFSAPTLFNAISIKAPYPLRLISNAPLTAIAKLTVIGLMSKPGFLVLCPPPLGVF